MSRRSRTPPASWCARSTATRSRRPAAPCVDSGLPDATDRARGDAHDTAAITYWWRVAGRQGTFVNAAYPVEQPPEIDRLEARLAELEEAAGGWPLSADE